MPARWTVEIEGDRFDLEEFPRWFPDGELFVQEDEGRFYVTGDLLDRYPDAEAVRKRVIETIDELTGVVRLLWPSIRKPRGGAVTRIDESGNRSVSVFLEGTISARAKASGNLTVLGAEPSEERRPTQAQELLGILRKSPRLLRALNLWADPQHSWGGLYTALDEIEKHLGKPTNQAGLCSRREWTLFRLNAMPERHAHGYSRAPERRMEISEGAAFIERLLKVIARRDGWGQ